MDGVTFSDWLNSAMTTPDCFVCAEVKAGKNKRETDRLRCSWLYSPTQPMDCELCHRPLCLSHAVATDRIVDSDEWFSSCEECYALKFGFTGERDLLRGIEKMSFRRRWRLYRWRVTKNRLVKRMRIGRVVEKVLCKDVADLVATYAVV